MTVNHKLTEREREVLKLIARGYSNYDIREKLVITQSTLATHIHSIYSKLYISATSRREASTMRVKAALIYLKEQGLLRG